MIKQIFVTGALALSVGLSSACSTSDSAIGSRNNNEARESVVASQPTVEPVVNAEASSATYRAEFKTEPGAVKAGEPASLVFNVKDESGATVRELPIVHEKPMHLLVTSSDLNEFYHIHPDPQADGTYRVTHTFPNAGKYKLYADFTPKDSAQVVEKIDLNVTGTVRQDVKLVEDKLNVKTVESLRVTMKPDKPLRAGDELMINFAVADAKTGRPATDLQPYLGAMAHFVIISEDTTDFLHAHPMTKDEMSLMGGSHGGMSHGNMAGTAHDDTGAKPHSHDAGELKDKAKSNESTSEVAAHTSFPRAGLYKVWVQFQHNNQPITVPFVVRVAEGDKQANVGHSNASPAVPADAIKVTVNGKGYEPSQIRVKKGQPVKLAFLRTDANNCGGTVVFPALNIKRELPVGQTVIVEVTPKETGELAFACGMNMMRGAFVVQ